MKTLLVLSLCLLINSIADASLTGAKNLGRDPVFAGYKNPADCPFAASNINRDDHTKERVAKKATTAPLMRAKDAKPGQGTDNG